MPLQLDQLTRVRNVKWASGVYVVLVSEGSEITASPDGKAQIIARQTDPELTGITGNPVTATLLECPATAGASFATIDAIKGLPDAAERIEGIVIPKSNTAKDNWFNMYVRPISGEREIPTAPFFWLLATMNVTAPRLIRFKIRFEPHLIDEPPRGSRMVQMYPNTDPIEVPKLAGYSVLAYRTDTKGTGTKFRAPPEWAVDEITNTGGRGLLFGKDPPLIAADIDL